MLTIPHQFIRSKPKPVVNHRTPAMANSIQLEQCIHLACECQTIWIRMYRSLNIPTSIRWMLDSRAWWTIGTMDHDFHNITINRLFVPIIQIKSCNRTRCKWIRWDRFKLSVWWNVNSSNIIDLAGNDATESAWSWSSADAAGNSTKCCTCQSTARRIQQHRHSEARSRPTIASIAEK